MNLIHILTIPKLSPRPTLYSPRPYGSDDLVGFNIGCIPEKFLGQYQAEWLADPVFAKNVFHIASPKPLDFLVYQDGFAAFEPEFILQIKSDAWKASEN